MQASVCNTKAPRTNGSIMMNQRQSYYRRQEDQTAGQLLVDQIEKLVLDGNQKGLVTFFEDWPMPPARVGDWELRVNERLLDGVTAGRTIHAIPLSVRARAIFEEGNIKRLMDLGFKEDEAHLYYKHAFKKKYVWVDSVLTAVKEMINGFQNEKVLQSYEISGDPRRLAMTTGIPANPYATTHSHFLVAVEMARLMIQSRLRKELKDSRAQEQKAAAMVAL